MTVAVRHAWIATVALLLTSKAHAATTCSDEVVTALRVPRVSISVAAPVPGKDGQPSHCLIEGSVVTTGQGAPDGRAGFQLRPSETWQQRFFFMGVDGNAGNFTPAVNQVDRLSALGKGYATIVTDTGHKGKGSDANWTVDANGKPNAATGIDFYHRAAHDVTVAGKALAEGFYGGRIARAYFVGCSTGGRMAMMAAQRYPIDFDGIKCHDGAGTGRTHQQPNSGVAKLELRASIPAALALKPADLQAATHALRSGETRYAAAPGWPGARFEFRSIATVQGRIGVLGIAPADGQRTTTLDDATTVETFLRHASIAIERTRLETEAVAVRKESEQERLRSALLASLSHNLRTPLASILGAVTSLRELGPNLPTEARADLLAVSAAVRIPEQARLPVCRQNFSYQEKLGATLVRQFSRRLLLLGDVGVR